MWTRRAVSGLMAAGAASAAARPVRASGGGRSAEIAALRRFAETTHPEGLRASLDPDWRSRWDRLAATADTLSDGAYITSARRGLAWFKDGHTTVLPFEYLGGPPAGFKAGPFGLYLPFRVRAFHDGAFVVGARDEAAPLLGARLTRLAGASVEQIIQAHAAAWPSENPAWPHNWASLAFNTAGALQGLELIKDPTAPILVEAVAPDGRQLSIRTSARPGADKDRTPLTPPRSAQETFAAEAKSGNYVRRLPEHAALYVSFDDLGDEAGITALTRAVVEAIPATGVERLVLDLRRNGGGDNYLSEPLRHELARSRLNRPGGLYVMTSPQTFSAAQNLCNRLERETFALFVGDPTGSAPNLHGDALPFTGPATGMLAQVSVKRWYDGGPDDKRRWIFPDVPVPSTFADWIKRRDPALDAALSHQADPSDSFEKRTTYFRRASQAQAWTPFWMKV